MLYSKNGLEKQRQFGTSNIFLHCAEDLNTIATRIMRDNDLAKLLYYTDKDCLSKQINDTQKITLLNKNIKIVPYLPKDEEMYNYIVIQFDSFALVEDEQEYMSYFIIIDVICHTDNWLLDEGKVRPYEIMNRLSDLLKGSKLSGVGNVKLVSTSQLLVSPNLSGFTMYFSAEQLLN